jgi:hypothetical protein
VTSAETLKTVDRHGPSNAPFKIQYLMKEPLRLYTYSPEKYFLYDLNVFSPAPLICLQTHITIVEKENNASLLTLNLSSLFLRQKYLPFRTASLYNSLKFIAPLKSFVFWDRTP